MSYLRLMLITKVIKQNMILYKLQRLIPKQTHTFYNKFKIVLNIFFPMIHPHANRLLYIRIQANLTMWEHIYS